MNSLHGTAALLLLSFHGQEFSGIQIDVQGAERALGKGVRVPESVGKRINKPTGKAGGI